MNRLTRTAIAVMASLGLLVPLAGCGSIQGKMEEKVTEKIAGEVLGGEVDLDTDDGSVTITDDDGGSMEIGGNELPADWPRDLPLPDDYQIIHVSDIDNDHDGRQITVAFAAPGEVFDVAGQLHQETLAAGYSVAEDSEEMKLDSGDIKSEIHGYESGQTQVLISVSSMADDDLLTISYGVWPEGN